MKPLIVFVKEIKIFEPIAKKNAQLEHKNLSNVIFTPNLPSSVKGVDSLIICTECREFWNIDPSIFTKLIDKNIFDGRNILDKELLTDAGINYFGVGR